jgi:hypothetical protein
LHEENVGNIQLPGIVFIAELHWLAEYLLNLKENILFCNYISY